MSNYGARADNCIRPDLYPLQYDRAGADPDVVPDPYWQAEQRLGRPKPLAVAVIMISDIAEWTDHAVVPDFDVIGSIEHRASIYIGSMAQANLSAASSLATAEQYDPIIQRNAVTKLDIPGIPWHTDPSYPAAVTDVCA